MQLVPELGPSVRELLFSFSGAIVLEQVASAQLTELHVVKQTSTPSVCSLLPRHRGSLVADFVTLRLVLYRVRLLWSENATLCHNMHGTVGTQVVVIQGAATFQLFSSKNESH